MKWFAVFRLAAVFIAQAAPKRCFTKAGHDSGINPRLLMAPSIQE
jgi:hypothetical protein